MVVGAQLAKGGRAVDCPFSASDWWSAPGASA